MSSLYTVQVDVFMTWICLCCKLRVYRSFADSLYLKIQTIDTRKLYEKATDVLITIFCLAN